MELHSAVTLWCLERRGGPAAVVQLEPRASWLGAAAGRGLFCLSGARAGTLLCEYVGTRLDTKTALRLKDKAYLMRLGPQCYVDAREHLHVLARFINDCRNPLGYNVVLEKQPESARALVKAKRDIQPGEELFVDYGPWYWAGAGFEGARLRIGQIIQHVQASRDEHGAGAVAHSAPAAGDGSNNITFHNKENTDDKDDDDENAQGHNEPDSDSESEALPFQDEDFIAYGSLHAVAPYITTPKHALEAAKDLAAVQDSDVVWELGCGKGEFSFCVASSTQCRAVGLDIDPGLIKAASAKARSLHVDDRVSFRVADLFDPPLHALLLAEATMLFLYLTPSMLGRRTLQEVLDRFLRAGDGRRIVCYQYGLEWLADFAEGKHVQTNELYNVKLYTHSAEGSGTSAADAPH